MALFQQLETDMSEVRSAHSEARQRTSSMSPMNGLSWKNRGAEGVPTNSLFLNVPGSKTAGHNQELPLVLQQLNLQDPPSGSISYPLVEEEGEDVEEEDNNDDQSDSDSLDDFADTLGGEGEEEEEEQMSVGAGTLGQLAGYTSRPSPYLVHHQTAPLAKEEELDSISAGSRGSQSSGLATVGVPIHPTTDSPSLPRATISRNLSNDSGVQFYTTDSDSTGTTSGQGSTASMQTASGGVAEDNNKKPSSLADEIFAMLNF